MPGLFRPGFLESKIYKCMGAFVLHIPFKPENIAGYVCLDPAFFPDDVLAIGLGRRSWIRQQNRLKDEDI